MSIDYDRISRTYDAHRSGDGPHLAVLVRLANEAKAARVLELGCGTGNSTATFLAGHPCDYVGLDASAGMLEKARTKGLPAKWVRASAAAIPLAAANRDFVFGSFVLHHLDSLDAVLQECARVLDHGCVAFATSPHDFIRRHPMNRYFPSFAEIDCARFQDEEAIRAALERAGFSGIRSERATSAPYPIDRAYADRVANRFVSTYDLLSEREFQEGLRRLYADVEARGQLDTPMIWEALVVWGCR
jgi:SAM-dependent methyltransferase